MTRLTDYSRLDETCRQVTRDEQGYLVANGLELVSLLAIMEDAKRYHESMAEDLADWLAEEHMRKASEISATITALRIMRAQLLKGEGNALQP